MKREEVLSIIIAKLREAAEYMQEYGWFMSARITNDTANELYAELTNLEERDKLRANCAREEAAIVKTKLGVMEQLMKQSGEPQDKLDHIMKSIKWIDSDFDLSKPKPVPGEVIEIKAPETKVAATAVDEAYVAESAYLACLIDSCIQINISSKNKVELRLIADRGDSNVVAFLHSVCLGATRQLWTVHDQKQVLEILERARPYMRITARIDDILVTMKGAESD